MKKFYGLLVALVVLSIIFGWFTINNSNIVSQKANIVGYDKYYDKCGNFLLKSTRFDTGDYLLNTEPHLDNFVDYTPDEEIEGVWWLSNWHAGLYRFIVIAKENNRYRINEINYNYWDSCYEYSLNAINVKKWFFGYNKDGNLDINLYRDKAHDNRFVIVRQHHGHWYKYYQYIERVPSEILAKDNVSYRMVELLKRGNGSLQFVKHISIDDQKINEFTSFLTFKINNTSYVAPYSYDPLYGHKEFINKINELQYLYRTKKLNIVPDLKPRVSHPVNEDDYFDFKKERYYKPVITVENRNAHDLTARILTKLDYANGVYNFNVDNIFPWSIEPEFENNKIELFCRHSKRKVYYVFHIAFKEQGQKGEIVRINGKIIKKNTIEDIEGCNKRINDGMHNSGAYIFSIDPNGKIEVL